MSAKRFRIKFLFWLDVNKPDEFQLAETIEKLKNERSYSRTIRDGIRLIVSLRQRRTDVLFALFPWLADELHVTPQPISTTTAGDDLKDQLQRLEDLILQTGATPIISSETPDFEGTGSPTALSVPTFDTPTFDDDDLDFDLDIKTNSNTNATNNFLNSLMNLATREV